MQINPKERIQQYASITLNLQRTKGARYNGIIFLPPCVQV